MNYSRKDFREIPLKFIVIPTLDAPVLVHWFDAPVFVDVDGRQCLCYAKLSELRGRTPRKPHDLETNPQAKVSYLIKLKVFAKELRKLWCSMVDQADGYSYPPWVDPPYAMFEFAPDA